MKSSDWRGAAGLSELTENGMIGRQMVCCRKIWEAPPPLQTSQMKTASPRPILFLFCVNFLCELFCVNCAVSSVPSPCFCGRLFWTDITGDDIIRKQESCSVQTHMFHVWSDFLSFGVCQWDFASVNQENVPHFLFVQRTPRESCEVSRRVQAGRTTTEEEVRIQGSHRNVTETVWFVHTCSTFSYYMCTGARFFTHQINFIDIKLQLISDKGHIR